MEINPLTAIDFYKADHRRQYPEGTEYVYSNFTPRSSHLAQMLPDFDDRVVFFGLQGFIKWFLIDTWNKEFFEKPLDEVLAKYKHRMDTSLGPDAIPTDHIEALHKLGYLPLEIRALPEGSRVNIRVPMFTITNTHPDFFWLVNYLETVLSAEIWKPCTTATIAYEYRRLLEDYAERTGGDPTFVAIQGHDFSSRGMSGVYDSSSAGAGHLLSFIGTDSVTAIDYLENYYDADPTVAPIGVSVPATEHSVMCMGGEEREIDTFRRLITELYPAGIVSIVSDSWDFWRVITEYAEELKPEILARKVNALGLAKVVFRPDSGDPVKIICGDPALSNGTPAGRGAVQCLWDVFGGTVNEKGYRTLNQRVGIIYGDSITLKRASAILKRLEENGFASDNIVFGIGSYTYQFMTRDTFGFAMKATWGQINGKGVDIFKDPVTDNGIKKSLKGRIQVSRDLRGKGTGYTVMDGCSAFDARLGELQPVFVDGALVYNHSLESIREALHAA